MKARAEYIDTLKKSFSGENVITDLYVMKECMKLSDEDVEDVYKMSLDNYRLELTMEKKKQLIEQAVNKQFEDELGEAGINESEPVDDMGDMEPKKPSGGFGGSMGSPSGMDIPSGGDMPKPSGGFGIEPPEAPELDSIETAKEELSKREVDFDFDNREATASDDPEMDEK